jgi:branched-chain amino acid transport system permease protein
VAGLLASLPVVSAEIWNIREMFTNASPALIRILTFSQESQAIGLLMLTGTIVLFSVLGAIVYSLPSLPRQIIISGLSAVLLIGVLQEFLSRINVIELIADFIFTRQGLSVAGAIIVFVVVAVWRLVWVTQGRRIKGTTARLSAFQLRILQWAALSLFTLFLISLPQLTDPFVTQIAFVVGLYTLMGLGLNIDVGLAGLLDLGFVGFFAIGAYTAALLTSTSPIGLGTVLNGEAGSSYTSFWVAVPIAVLAASLAGVFLGIPVLRTRGDYLAIVTLGLAEIIRILVLSDFLRPVLGGAQGVLNIPKPEIFGFTIKDPKHFYYLVLIGCFIIGFVAWRLQAARIGRNWMAIREDEDVAEAMGINPVASKLLAFGIGAGFAGLSGAIFASQLASVFPHSFGLIISINVLSLIIIGGIGSIPGVIIGSLVLVGLPELLREFSEFRFLIYGALLVVMMLVRPEGFWPSEVRQRELHAEEEVDATVATAQATALRRV